MGSTILVVHAIVRFFIFVMFYKQIIGLETNTKLADGITPLPPKSAVGEDPNDIHFYLYTSSNQQNSTEEIIYNYAPSLRESSFQFDRKTVFIIHGFLNNGTSLMPQLIKNAYLQAGLQFNYIIVDWGKLANPKPPKTEGPLYALVVANVPTVGERVADFINFLLRTNASEDLHIIGHSLGAHISGLAGLKLQEKYTFLIDRITGLDPAGPLFFPPITCRNIVRTDAKFVDIIHTNVWAFGDSTRDGHIDFYPNGGAKQPNCTSNDSNINLIGSALLTGFVT